MARGVGGVTLAALLAVALGGCLARTGREIQGASVDPTGMVLTVNPASCKGHPTVEDVESDTEVRLSAVADRADADGGACLDGVVLELQSALGTRTVVDTATGEEVEVRKAAPPGGG